MAQKSIRITGLAVFVGLMSFSFSLISGCTIPFSGEKLFFTVGCSQCHSFKGRGGRMGPDLSAVTNIRTDEWINNYLQDPKKMNPFARMPSFGHLSSSKRKAIISYLKK